MMTVRTLVVDDERLARQRILRLLRPEPDIEVVGECSDGRQALAIVRSVAPQLMFLDLQMPGLSGFDVLAALRAAPLPVIIVVTAYDHLAAEAFELKAIDYLVKPFNRERLGHALKHARARIARIVSSKGNSEDDFGRKI